MAKFDIPRFRYLTQDLDGAVWMHSEEPYLSMDDTEWLSDATIELIENFRFSENKDWRNTLIDLDVDDYEFKDGILRRIEK